MIELGRILGRVRRSQTGSALLEFIIVLPMLMLLLVGIFEFSRMFYTRLTVRHAVSEATRFAVTGNVLNDTLGNPMTRALSISETIQHSAENLAVDVANVTISPSDGGGPEEVVTVSVTFEYDYAMQAMKDVFPVAFTVSTSMRNEPFFQ